MTKIEAVVSPGRLEDVQRLFAHEWVGGLTVTEVKGLAGGPPTRYRGALVPPGLVPLLRIELVVPTPMVPRLLHDLAHWLQAGRSDDGYLHAGPVEGVVRIRTGEQGEGAL